MIEIYQNISKYVDKYDRNVLYYGKDMDNPLRIMEKTYQSTKRNYYYADSQRSDGKKRN